MTTFNLDNNSAGYQIKSYRPGMVKINDQTYHHSIIVAPEALILDWSITKAQDLTTTHLARALELHPDILLIGTGAEQVFLHVELYGFLINAGVGVEVMSTAAACRTYNALSAESRNVAAALII